MRRTLKILAAAALLAAPQMPAGADEDLAEIREGDFGRLSLGVRYAQFDPEDGDKAEFPGVQVKWYPSREITLEGSVDGRENDLGGGAGLKVYPVQATVLANILPRKQVKPFLLAGVGWYFTTLEVPGRDDETEDRLGLHAGAGLQYMFSRAWSIDGSYRHIWLEDIEAGGGTGGEVNDDGPMYTVGLNYHF
jgi:hypothetical protein